MDPLRIGLIGCGEIAARAAVPAIGATQWARVVATMDASKRLAKDLAANTGAEFCTDDENELLRRDEVEAVIISTPHHLHAPLGIKAAKHKKHVLVEKPIATTTASAKRLIQACRKHRVKLSVAYTMRFQANVAKAMTLIRQGALGRLNGFSLISVGEKPESYWRSGYSGRIKTDWRMKRETAGGGFLIMNFTHNIDLIQSMLNLEPRSVFAQYDTFRTQVEVEDYISVVVRYGNGAIGTFLGSTVCPGALRQPDHIFGTHGTIVLSDPLRVFTRKKIRGLKPDEWNEVKTKPNQARADLIENFAKAVRGKAKLGVTGPSAMTSLRVIKAAYRSQETNRPVRLR